MIAKLSKSATFLINSSHLILVLVFLISSDVCYSEVVKSQVKVIIRPSTQAKFSLLSGTKIDCLPLKDDWTKIGLFVKVGINQFKEKQLLPPMSLYDQYGKSVGELLDTINFKYGFYDMSKDGRPINFIAYITGEIGSEYIDYLSVPENILACTIDSCLDYELHSFQNQIKQFDYKKSEIIVDSIHLTEYYFYSPIIESIDPPVRIRLVFYDKKLIFICHDRAIKFDKFQSKIISISPGRKIYLTIINNDHSSGLIQRAINFYKPGRSNP